MILWPRLILCTCIARTAIAQSIPLGCNSASMGLTFELRDNDGNALPHGFVISEGDMVHAAATLYTFDVPPYFISCWNEGGQIVVESRDGIPHILAGPITPYGVYQSPEQSYTLRHQDCIYTGGALWFGVDCRYSGGYMVGYPLITMMSATDSRWVRMTPLCTPDTDGDGQVSITDLMNVIDHWGPSPFAGATADVTGNGQIDMDDLLAVIMNWGACP